MMTDTDTCPRCSGLTVRELVMMRDEPAPMPTEEASRWWRTPGVPVRLQAVPIVQTRCVNCGGVQFS